MQIDRDNFRGRAPGVASWIWDVTLDKMEWFGNPDALLGTAPEAFSGRYEDYLGRLHPDDALAAKCTFVESLMGRRPCYRAEERLLWPDGSVRWLEIFGHAEHADGCAVRMAGVLCDITEQRRAEERIRELEAFSLAVSHDLRAPLRTIAGFAELLRADCASALDEEGRQHLERIRVAAKNMGEMIEGLLDLSTSGRRDLEFGAVSLGALAAELIEYLRPACSFTGEACVGELPAAHGDARLIRQVLQNLLANAMKFTRKAQAPRIDLSAQAVSGGLVEYCVRDNGCGFDMKHAGRVFGVLERLHSQEEYEGAGIGLATVRRIVERHGGSVRAEGAPGRGAAFYFTLRAA